MYVWWAFRTAVTGGTLDLPQPLLPPSGCSQVLAKYCTNALVTACPSRVTLAKSGNGAGHGRKSLLGGASYSLRQYAQVAVVTRLLCRYRRKRHPRNNQRWAWHLFSFVLMVLPEGAEARQGEAAKALTVRDYMFSRTFICWRRRWCLRCVEVRCRTV